MVNHEWQAHHQGRSDRPFPVPREYAGKTGRDRLAFWRVRAVSRVDLQELPDSELRKFGPVPSGISPRTIGIEVKRKECRQAEPD